MVCRSLPPRFADKIRFLEIIKVLVIGGAGFIKSHLVSAIRSNDFSIFFDNFASNLAQLFRSLALNVIRRDLIAWRLLNN